MFACDWFAYSAGCLGGWFDLIGLFVVGIVLGWLFAFADWCLLLLAGGFAGCLLVLYWLLVICCVLVGCFDFVVGLFNVACCGFS